MNALRQAMRQSVKIDGQKIILRDLRVEDITQDYVDWMNDPEVVRFTESRFTRHSFSSVTDFVRSCAESPDSTLLGIFLKEGDLHIGNIKLGPVNWHHSLADIGLILGRRSCWGQGFATEAIDLIREHAFSTLGLHKLTAGCYASNAGSARAFLKAGFVQEGRRLQHVKCGAEWEDVIEMGCLNPFPSPNHLHKGIIKNG